jgi:PhnB protein
LRWQWKTLWSSHFRQWLPYLLAIKARQISEQGTTSSWPRFPTPAERRGGNHETGVTMKLLTYLNYGGNCRQAFEFYEAHLAGHITMLTTHGEQPEAGKVPRDWKNAVLHARIDIGGTTILGADIPPERFQPMRSAYISLMADSVEEAERTYALLAEGGEIFMPMAETFFASRFAMLRDRFGTSWMILHERPEPH